MRGGGLAWLWTTNIFLVKWSFWYSFLCAKSMVSTVFTKMAEKIAHLAQIVPKCKNLNNLRHFCNLRCRIVGTLRPGKVTEIIFLIAIFYCKSADFSS